MENRQFYLVTSIILATAAIIIYKNRTKKRKNRSLWVEPLLTRRAEGRGCLHLLNQELRTEDVAASKNLHRMSLFKDLLQVIKPPTWTEELYSTARYKLIAVANNSQEYRNVLAEYKNHLDLKVLAIYRIQHPFAFCRFKLRQRHLYYSTGFTPQERRLFFRLSNDANLASALTYNCDSRRDCAFYDTYTTANLRRYSSKYVVVAKTFEGQAFNERDSNRFPEYLIECDLSNNNLPSGLDNSALLLFDKFNRLAI